MGILNGKRTLIITIGMENKGMEDCQEKKVVRADAKMEGKADESLAKWHVVSVAQYLSHFILRL